MPTPSEEPDLVARRLVMPRAVWDHCVAEAARRNGGPWDPSNRAHVTAFDVATEALRLGLWYGERHGFGPTK